ncbi:endo-beta-N-acetylglucosaminidase [Paenibacillus sp. CAA11]|uniref:endo-beta-N-acetylglucosaminidase n=1 Tax=Paenibacillus sp. CAA11 TaxID=1532905 RepID=UPI000D3A173F|nr:endo-beta-N-acetylglucosaminidase [Paenibacillus sp. CAA11]AWB44945.1 endo-beta-N-acetylglucosaminidase [Paenibacillus sp. CAA11]
MGRMRRRRSSKVVAAAAAVSLAFSFWNGNLLPAALAGDTLPIIGQGEIGSNQPVEHGYRAQDFLNWNPAADPFAEYLRARIPLQPRIDAYRATQANPKLNPKTSLFNLAGDYGNSFFESFAYNDNFSNYLFNFWQYTDYYGSWHGMATSSVPKELYDPTADWTQRKFEFGILNFPNPAYTNAAHKNGVMSLGCIFLPREGQYHKDWVYKTADGKMPMADKLIEAAKYYGFDGYFLNQETDITKEEIPVFQEFTKYIRDHGLYIQWYDSVINTTGEVQYQREFNSKNSTFVYDPKLGQVSDSIFIDYPWNKTKIQHSVSLAKSLGVDPLTTLYAGVEAGGDRFGNMRNDLRNTLDAEGNTTTGIAMLGAEFVFNGLDEDLGTSSPDQNNRAKPQYQAQVFKRERKWWSGPNEDPTHTGRTQTNGSYWDGVAHYITERSVINSTFFTNFNTGHGTTYFSKGKVSNEHEWSNMTIQDLLPTWQWWMDSTGSHKLKADFDYGMAYEGGSSLAVSGILDGTNDLRLYKTDIPVQTDSKLSLTYKTGKANQATHMKVGLIFKDAPDQIEYLEIGKSKTAGWDTEVLDISAYTGRDIAAIGLNFDSDIPIVNYQIHIGELKVLQQDVKELPAPEGFKIDQALDTGEMYVSWKLDDYSKVKKYNLYAKLSNGSTVFLGGTYDDVFYVKSLYGETGKVKLMLKAVGADGREGAAAETSYDFSKEARKIHVTSVESYLHAGNLKVSWERPSANVEKLRLEVFLTHKPSDVVYSSEVEASAGKAELAVPLVDGSDYSLKITSVDKHSKASTGIYHTGKLTDVVPPEPYSGDYHFGEGRDTRPLKLDTPVAYDWWHLYTYADGAVRMGKIETDTADFPYKVRGKSQLMDIETGKNSMDYKFKDRTMLTLYLEDYAGNLSDPSSHVVLFNPDAQLTPSDVPDPILLKAIEAQAGVTLKEIVNYQGKVDLSGLPITNLKGLELLKSASEIDLSRTNITTIPEGIFDGALLKKLDISHCERLATIEAAFTGTVNPLVINIEGDYALISVDLSKSSVEKVMSSSPEQYAALRTVDLSNAGLDFTKGTPEQVWVDGLITAGAQVKLDGQKPKPYIRGTSGNVSVPAAIGEYDLIGNLKVQSARGTDYFLLKNASFLASGFDVEDEIRSLGIQADIRNPNGVPVGLIDLAIPGSYQVVFRSLAEGIEVGNITVTVQAASSLEEAKNVKQRSS